MGKEEGGVGAREREGGKGWEGKGERGEGREGRRGYEEKIRFSSRGC